ncbi:MAG TPA: penicillin acylase family protein, partial [Candidatus Binatus sp.]|nr:penicillin acylase family protein [Candidatus Binatus sp.]
MQRRVRFLASLPILAVLLVPAVVRATDITGLPITQTLTFAGLSAPADVVRDSHGIPHVYASNLNDAALALGYVHATDRLFQMDIFRRIPSGTVSELLGFPDFQIGSPVTAPPFPGNIGNVTQDLFFKTLGLRRAAVDSFNALSPSVQSALESYARGVNEVIGLANATGNLPPEYVSLNISHIEPWVPVDSVVFGKLQAFQLSFDFDDGLTGDLASVTGALGPATGETAFYQDLARSEPAENAFTVPDGNGTPIPLAANVAPRKTMVASAAGTRKRATTLQSPAHGRLPASTAARLAAVATRKEAVRKANEFIAKLLEQPAMRAIRERGVLGSNEWAVDGTVTNSGHPILANDPHLGLGSPATFYELHINTKDRGGDTNVTGIGFAGAPGVVQGHNEDIAWGSTTNPTDVTDWYLEDISSDANGNLFSHYLGNPEPITQLPLQVKVNVDNGNETASERQVLSFAAGIPIANVKGVIDVTGLLAQFVPPKVLVVGRHGPIFPQTLSPFPFPPNHTGGAAVSIQFTGLFPTRELETFFIWDKATNLTEFKTGLQAFDFGSQNWSYEDTAGNIAYFASGEFPVREDIAAGAISGNPPWVFRNGTGGNEWKALVGPPPADQAVPYEIVPTADIPHIENPPAHFFVSANNDPIGNTADNDPLNEALAGTAPYLSRDYDEFRAARITELIKSELNLIPTPPGTPAGDGTISFADMQRMQADVNQLDGRRLAKYFVTAVTNAQGGGAPPELSSLLNSRILDAKARLSAWTYNTPAGFNTTGDPGVPTAQDLIDSVATTIYNVALGRLVANTFDATLATNGIGFRQGTSSALRGLLRLLDKVPFTGVGASGLNFFDDPSVSLSAANERDIILVKSLQQGLDLLGGGNFTDAYALSQNVDDYLWGKVHYLIFQSFLDGALNNTHIPGGGAYSIPPQPSPFPPGYPTDGSRFTVDVANFSLRPTTENDLAFGSGPNRRSVVEMGPTGPVQAKNVIPGGEDGVVGHPHYGDQINDWLSNQTHDTLLATADVVSDAQTRTNFPNFRCTDSGVGRCVPGKGNRTTECAAEFFVNNAPVDELAIRMATITVTDGGAGDLDATANGSCVVQLMVCINNNDPRLTDAGGAQCQSPNVASYQLKRPLPDVGRDEDKANGAAILATLGSLGPSSASGPHAATLTFTPAVTAQDSCVDTFVVIPIHNGRPTKKFFKS